MAEYSTNATEQEKFAVISLSDFKGDENDAGIVENVDGSPHITLPPEVWAAVINCEYCILINCNSIFMFIDILYLYLCTLACNNRSPV